MIEVLILSEKELKKQRPEIGGTWKSVGLEYMCRVEDDRVSYTLLVPFGET